MDRFESIKAIIDTYIKENGNEEITGEVLNNVLNAMLDDISHVINGLDFGGERPISIVVDNVMSDTSSNPVQNKVIKAYVDAVKAELDAIVGGDATDAIESINEILAFLSTMADSDTLAGIVANLKKMIQEGDDGNIRYTDDAIAALKLYLDDADNDLDEKIGNLAEHIDAVDNTFIFSYDSTTNKATAEMVAGLASAITANKLIICNGRVYKFILEQDGMYGLVSDAYMDITDGKLKTSILAVTASTYDVQLMEQEVPTGTEITESTVAGWGFTKNAGTITGIKMNGATKGTSGVVDLGTVITEHQKLKTINNQSIVGEGNITIQGGGATPRVEMTAASAVLQPNTFHVWPMMDALDLTLGTEQSGVMNRYLFQFRNPKAGLTMLTLPDDITWSEDTELDENGLPVMEAAAYYRIEIIEGLASLKKWKLVYIQFADKEVERVLMANGIGDGSGITKRDAAAVSSLGTMFKSNKVIETFDELVYFKGISALGKDEWVSSNAPFYQCEALKSIVFPPTMKTIGAFAFYGCKAMETFNTASAEKICFSAFMNCTGLTKIEADKVKVVLQKAFYGCSNLREVVFKSLVELKSGAADEGTFYGCSIPIIDLPDTMESIGNYTFYGCANLKKIVCRAVTPPSLGANALYLANALLRIFVPTASVESYRNATNWNAWAGSILPIEQKDDPIYGLTSDGKAYIKTDYYPSVYDNVSVIFDKSASSSIQMVCGSRENANGKQVFISTSNSKSNCYFTRFYNNNTPTYTPVEGANNIVLSLRPNDSGALLNEKVVRNGQEIYSMTRTNAPTDYTLPFPFVVFASNTMGSSAIDSRIYAGTIYGVKITDSRTGEVKVSLTPKAVDGVAGMYDEVSGKFYTNSNTQGVFTLIEV